MSASRKELRGFGLGVGGILLLLAVLTAFGLWPFATARPGVGAGFGVLGAALALLGSAAPLRLRQVHAVWMRVVQPIAWFNTRLLLGVTYYGVLFPTGLLRRLGSDPLRLRNERRPSYWIRRDPNDDLESYKRQV